MQTIDEQDAARAAAAETTRPGPFERSARARAAVAEAAAAWDGQSAPLVWDRAPVPGPADAAPATSVPATTAGPATTTVPAAPSAAGRPARTPAPAWTPAAPAPARGHSGSEKAAGIGALVAVVAVIVVTGLVTFAGSSGSTPPPAPAAAPEQPVEFVIPPEPNAGLPSSLP